MKMPITPMLEPETCQNVMKYVNCDVWFQAMKEVYEALMNDETLDCGKFTSKSLCSPLHLDLQSEIQL
jgi:hypothetical protein